MSPLSSRGNDSAAAAVDGHAEPGDEATRELAPPAATGSSEYGAPEATEGAESDAISTVTMASDDEDSKVVDKGLDRDRKASSPARAGDAAPSTTTPAATEAEANSDPDQSPPAKRRALCDICHSAPAKYKCPRCPQAYCSVVCSRTHRDNHPPEMAPGTTATTTAPAPPPPPPPASSVPTATNNHPFHVLDDAPELQQLFAQYPGLPARLRAIYEATQPPAPTMSSSPADGGSWRGGGRGRGRGGGFHGFRGGRGGESSFTKPSQPWTREQGLRQGQRALRIARVDPGDDGDGVRAYCEVVLHLLAGRNAKKARRNARGADETPEANTEPGHAAAADMVDATALVRQEVARADTQLVEQLLQAEAAAGELR